MRWLRLSGVTLLLTSCMLGPDFHTPDKPDVQSFTEQPLPKQTASASGPGGRAQKFVDVKCIPKDWWYLFHSPQLNTLMKVGFDNSPTVAAAQAAVRAAQENYKEQFGSLLLPQANISFDGQRQLLPGSVYGGSFPSVMFNLWDVNIPITYTFDLWGGLRRQVELAGAQVDYQRYELAATYLTLAGNIATTSITIASLRDQIKATKKLIAIEADQLAIMRKQFKDGGISYENVLTQETLVEQTTATLPPLQKSYLQNKAALSALVGKYPSQHLPEMDFQKMVLPETLPVSVPSNLVRQRPDVAAYEALVHQATAQIGVATANLFPTFSLAANTAYGWMSGSLGGLINDVNNAWLYGGSLTQALFHGGALLAARRQAVAALDQSFAQYRQTVLNAFKDVASALSAIEADARTYRAQRRAEIASEQNLYLTKQQYLDGGVSYLTLLTAQQQYQQAVINRIQAQQNRFSDTASLYQALGGGWWQGG